MTWWRLQCLSIEVEARDPRLRDIIPRTSSVHLGCSSQSDNGFYEKSAGLKQKSFRDNHVCHHHGYALTFG